MGMKQSGNRPLMMPSNVTNQFLDKEVISSLIDKKMKAQNQPINKPTDGKVAMSNTSYKRSAPNQLKTVHYNFENQNPIIEQQKNGIHINPF